jgi:uncharacterized membrane protein
VSLARISDRRLVTLVALVLASCACVGLVVLRAHETGTNDYGFLVWNLFLAWLPFVFALAVYDGYRRGRGRLYLVAFGALWLLFLPNAPYIVTDFIHLDEHGGAPLWYDGLTVAGFAGTGLVIGLGSLFLVQTVVTAARGALVGWTLSATVLGLSSVGIYLGRFVGVNSWDALVHPASVLRPFFDRLDDPFSHPRFVAVTIILTAFLMLTYVLLYNLAHLGLALEPRRPRR